MLISTEKICFYLKVSRFALLNTLGEIWHWVLHLSFRTLPFKSQSVQPSVHSLFHYLYKDIDYGISLTDTWSTFLSQKIQEMVPVTDK